MQHFTFLLSLLAVLFVHADVAFGRNDDDEIPALRGFEPGIRAIYYRRVKSRPSLAGRTLFNTRDDNNDQETPAESDSTPIHGVFANHLAQERNRHQNSDRKVLSDYIGNVDDSDLTSKNGQIVPIRRSADDNKNRRLDSRRQADDVSNPILEEEEPAELGNSCLNDSQCSRIDSKAICYNGLCVCEPINHIAGSASNCSSNNMNNNEALTNVDQEKLICMRKRNLGKTCCDNRQCRFQVPNSECSNTSFTCGCKSGYVPLGDHMCLPEQPTFVGKCSISTQCITKHSQCGQEGYCEPANGYVYADRFTSRPEENLKRLRETQITAKMNVNNATTQFHAAAWLGEPCTQDNQCLAYVPNVSECSKAASAVLNTFSKKICACKRGYVSLGLSTCLETVDTLYDKSRPCAVTRQCTQKYSTCAIPSNLAAKVVQSTRATNYRVTQCVCDSAYQFAFPASNQNNNTAVVTHCCSYADYPHMSPNCLRVEDGMPHNESAVAFSLFSVAQPEKAAEIMQRFAMFNYNNITQNAVTATSGADVIVTATVPTTTVRSSKASSITPSSNRISTMRSVHPSDIVIK